MERTVSETFLVTKTEEINVMAATCQITNLIWSPDSSNMTLILTYFDSTGTQVSQKSVGISDTNYTLLLSESPSFALNKPSGSFRECDLWFMVDYITAGAPTIWAEKTVYAVGDIRYYGKNVYTCTTAGTSGMTAPSATSGTIIDGTVVWASEVIAAYKATLPTTEVQQNETTA